jgi:hypothetical protein
MKNKFLRLLVVLSKLTAAEKMSLDRFLQSGEYLAYKFSTPLGKDINFSGPEISEFVFFLECDIDKNTYSFNCNNIDDFSFETFEIHLSQFLNVLFERKLTFEKELTILNDVVRKLRESLNQEELNFLSVSHKKVFSVLQHNE